MRFVKNSMIKFNTPTNMKIISVKRKLQFENRYHPNMGRLITKVIRIQKTFLGMPYKTLYMYRETYEGEIKDCEDCVLSKI